MEDDILLELFQKDSTIASWPFILSILISFLLSYLLSKIYIYRSNTLSNPISLARIFPLLSITTTIIIAVIKSSLALSLGLVGALSIIRFRTPIKEPEELVYIFLCITIGIATGANQNKLAVIGVFLATLCIYTSKLLNKNKINSNRIKIVINSFIPNDIPKLIEITSKYSIKLEFHNLSVNNYEGKKDTSISFSLIPNKFNDINLLVNEITEIFPKVSLSIIDNPFY